MNYTGAYVTHKTSFNGCNEIQYLREHTVWEYYFARPMLDILGIVLFSGILPGFAGSFGHLLILLTVLLHFTNLNIDYK